MLGLDEGEGVGKLDGFDEGVVEGTSDPVIVGDGETLGAVLESGTPYT